MPLTYAPAIRIPQGNEIQLEQELEISNNLKFTIQSGMSNRSKFILSKNSEKRLYEVISLFLRYGFSIRDKIATVDGTTIIKKYVPSGGSMHALVAFLVFENKVYRYNEETHCLVDIDAHQWHDSILELARAAMNVKTRPRCVIAVGLRVGRGDVKYGRKNGKYLAFSDLGAIYMLLRLLSAETYVAGCPLGPHTFNTLDIWEHEELIGGWVIP